MLLLYKFIISYNTFFILGEFKFTVLIKWHNHDHIYSFFFIIFYDQDQMLPEDLKIFLSFLFIFSYILFSSPQAKNHNPTAVRHFQNNVIVGPLMLL